MDIGIVNQSSSVNTTDFYCMVAAARDQIDNEFSSAWGTESGPAALYIYDNIENIPDGYWIYTIVDDPEQASYFGYHYNNSPISQSILFADTIINYGCPVLYNSSDPGFFTVSSMFCHEILEMIIDPCVNGWWDGPGLTLVNGFTPIASYASEVCDPVYFDIYTKTISGDIGLSSPLSSPVHVNVCNFIYPTWKDYYADSSSQFDQMGILTSSFSMSSGGYLLVRSADYMTEQYIYGARFPTQFKQYTRLHSRATNRIKKVPHSLYRPINKLPRNALRPMDKS